DTRHIPIAGPAFEVTAVVFWKAGKAAIGHQGSNSSIKRGCKHAIVSAQRMADAADSLAVDLRKRLQHVNRSHVVPNGFHSAALISAPSEIVRVIPETGVIRRQGHVATLRKMRGIPQTLLAPNPGWF